MVSIRESHNHLDERYFLAQFDVDQWILSTLGLSHPKTIENLKEMWDFCFEQSAGTKEQERCFQNGIEMVEILSMLNMDSDSLCAGLLFPFLDTKIIRREDIVDKFDYDILTLVTSMIRMKEIKQLRAIKNGQVKGEQIDSIRRMLLAMVNDFRSVIIKLAERIMYLRDLIHAPQEEQIIAAKECFSIYAPLANRLGIGQLKWELEDFCFRYLHPDEYHQIAKNLDEKRSVRERYVKDFVQHLQSLISQEQITAEVYGRPKHIYSIWRKMEQKHLQFEQLFDLRAVRVICNKIEDCYRVLSIIHSHYRHLPNEFDDYIANPKSNGYQSIHTIIQGPQQKIIEIQIRTETMHNQAELGVAAHWKYKEGSTDKMTAYDERISWLRQVLAWQQEMYENGEIKEAVHSQVFDDRVYVFTPKGDVIDLASGSTPLDFAYHIHSDVGHRCIGAKINGRIVPFATQLKMGDQVDIITQKEPNPSRDWLSPSLGFIASNRSRAKIQAWFKKQDREKNILAGKIILDELLSSSNLVLKEVETLLIDRYNAHNIDEILASLGSGDIRQNQLANYLNLHFNKKTAQEEDQAVLKQFNKLQSQKQPKEDVAQKNSQVTIDGVGNLMISIARCCRPIPGDSIAGFITQGRGISIHRVDCEQFLELSNHLPERIVHASWNITQKNNFSLLICVIGLDRTGLLRDITTVFANEKVLLRDVNCRNDAKNEVITFDFEVELNDVSILNRLLLKIEQIQDVISAKRFHDS